MSDDSEYDVGYGKPPREHRFKKGRTGNPRGRPPKVARAISERQVRGDVLRACEELIMITTTSGQRRRVSIKEAIEQVQIRKALQGHGPSIRAVLKRYGDAVQGHAAAYARDIAYAERAELKLLQTPTPKEKRREAQKMINTIRRFTRFF